MAFIAFCSASSSVVIGGGRRSARSVPAVLMTLVAKMTGRPLNFAAISGDTSTL
jgi:hypothetical protein